MCMGSPLEHKKCRQVTYVSMKYSLHSINSYYLQYCSHQCLFCLSLCARYVSSFEFGCETLLELDIVINVCHRLIIVSFKFQFK